MFHLIKGILDDNEHRRVCAAQPPVERLKAEAVARGAVRELPGMTDRPGGQLCAKLGRETRQQRWKTTQAIDIEVEEKTRKTRTAKVKRVSE